MEDTLYDAAVGAIESIPRARRKDLDLLQESVRRAIRAHGQPDLGQEARGYGLRYEGLTDARPGQPRRHRCSRPCGRNGVHIGIRSAQPSRPRRLCRNMALPSSSWNCRIRKVELPQPLGADSPIAAFLEKNPSGGMHHICYEVGDILAATRPLDPGRRKGAWHGEPKIGAHGKPVLFLHPEDFFGTLIELEQVCSAAAE